jgi:NAD(P)-dependent dehydrogenase (short-subunit alcohol dehydrogenase family)
VRAKKAAASKTSVAESQYGGTLQTRFNVALLQRRSVRRRIMDLQLLGKRAIVTGGSSGIGLAVAHGLAMEGADVAIVARRRDALASAGKSLLMHGHQVASISADMRDGTAVKTMVDQVVRELGGVDILINSAATPTSPGGTIPPTHVSDDALRGEFETKVLGYLRSSRLVAPLMVAQGWGRIINISGLGARRTGSLAGSVRNVAVSALTKNLADELGPYGINVTVVHPGATVTDNGAGRLAGPASDGARAQQRLVELTAATSIGRLVTAEEVAAVVVFLASPLSVAITGDAVAVGGGAVGAIHY